MTYYFGGIKEYSLEQIENEVLNESVYLDVFAGSDLRLKENIQEVPSTIKSLQKLDVIKYSWKPEIKNHLTQNEGEQVGVVAQQVVEFFPELVKKDSETGYLTVNYSKLTAHLLVAIKELNTLVETQNQRITQLEKHGTIKDFAIGDKNF